MADKRAASARHPRERFARPSARACSGSRRRETGAFSLNVPTGGGKTPRVAGLRPRSRTPPSAGSHRLCHSLHFGDRPDSVDLSRGPRRGRDPRTPFLDRTRKTTMRSSTGTSCALRWKIGAPIIVTTNVQLFESLHANRPSRCRRLHNPRPLRHHSRRGADHSPPCAAPLRRRAGRTCAKSGASVVICTSTQPAIAAPNRPRADPRPGAGVGTRPMTCTAELKRVRIAHGGAVTDSELLAQLESSAASLVIVNSRPARARSLSSGEGGWIGGRPPSDDPTSRHDWRRNSWTRQAGAERRRALPIGRDVLVEASNT